WKYRNELRSSKFLRVVLPILLFIAFLDTPILSESVWRVISRIAQGSWRFYIFIVLIIAIFVALSGQLALQKWGSAMVWFWMFGALLPLILILGNFHFFGHTNDPPGDRPEYLPAHVSQSLSSTLSTGFYQPAQNTDASQYHISGPTRISFHRFYWPAW